MVSELTRNTFFTCFFLCFSLAAAEKQCDRYGYIEAKGYGNTRKSAADDADIKIAEKISSALNLQDRKTGKGIHESSETNRAVWTHNMGRACAEAIKPIPNKIWEKLKGKINIGDNK
ncbi:MAG: hypothetical protein LBU89_10015 [Fibromonadaceae bacterium]|jgi:hypothetical protein|nr:hypothetical protein [Fibromonadaceae bacterium]